VAEGCRVGSSDDFTPNKARPDLLWSGISLVGKRARLPAGLGVGRNCIISPNAREADFSGAWVESGETVRTHRASPVQGV